MRELSFRIWDKKEKTMFLSPIEIEHLGSWFDAHLSGAIADTGNKIVMQNTGLTDKNGKKIFEGDIVYITKFYKETYHRGCEEDNNLEVWSETVDTLNLSAEVKHEGSSFMFKEYYLDIFDKEELEVIGNIHDNPELVEEELK